MGSFGRRAKFVVSVGICMDVSWVSLGIERIIIAHANRSLPFSTKKKVKNKEKLVGFPFGKKKPERKERKEVMNKSLWHVIIIHSR